jgi:hypothetical protein
MRVLKVLQRGLSQWHRRRSPNFWLGVLRLAAGLMSGPGGRLVGKSNQAPAAIIHQALTEVLVRQRPRRTGKDCAETRRIAGAENRPSDRVRFP